MDAETLGFIRSVERSLGDLVRGQEEIGKHLISISASAHETRVALDAHKADTEKAHGAGVRSQSWMSADRLITLIVTVVMLLIAAKEAFYRKVDMAERDMARTECKSLEQRTNARQDAVAAALGKKP